MSSILRADHVAASSYRHVPALTLAVVVMASLANLQLQFTRSLLLALVALAGMTVLPPGRLPTRRPALQIAALALLAAFGLGLLRVLLFREFDSDSLGVVSSVVGMCACWFIGATAAAWTHKPLTLLTIFACWVPLAGAALLSAAFLNGAHPETNYWQFVDSVTSDGGRRLFAVSEDSLGLLVFFVGATPYCLSIRSLGARLAILGGIAATFALLVLNGQVTYIVSALCAGLAPALLGRRSLPLSQRGLASVPLLIALGGGLVATGYVFKSRPDFAAPIVASLTNKDFREGNNVFDGRDEFWRESIPHLGESPLVGHPLGEPTTPETRYAYNNPHNDYLLTALKFGVPAALLLLVVVGRITWELATTIRRPPNDVARSAALVGLAAWASLWLPPLFKGALSSPFYANLGLAGISGLCFTLVRLYTPAPVLTAQPSSAASDGRLSLSRS